MSDIGKKNMYDYECVGMYGKKQKNKRMSGIDDKYCKYDTYDKTHVYGNITNECIFDKNNIPYRRKENVIYDNFGNFDNYDKHSEYYDYNKYQSDYMYRKNDTYDGDEENYGEYDKVNNVNCVNLFTVTDREEVAEEVEEVEEVEEEVYNDDTKYVRKNKKKSDNNYDTDYYYLYDDDFYNPDNDIDYDYNYYSGRRDDNYNRYKYLKEYPNISCDTVLYTGCTHSIYMPCKSETCKDNNLLIEDSLCEKCDISNSRKKKDIPKLSRLFNDIVSLKKESISYINAQPRSGNGVKNNKRKKNEKVHKSDNDIFGDCYFGERNCPLEIMNVDTDTVDVSKGKYIYQKFAEFL